MNTYEITQEDVKGAPQDLLAKVLKAGNYYFGISGFTATLCGGAITLEVKHEKKYNRKWCHEYEGVTAIVMYFYDSSTSNAKKIVRRLTVKDNVIDLEALKDKTAEIIRLYELSQDRYKAQKLSVQLAIETEKRLQADLDALGVKCFYFGENGRFAPKVRKRQVQVSIDGITPDQAHKIMQILQGVK